MVRPRRPGPRTGGIASPRHPSRWFAPLTTCTPRRAAGPGAAARAAPPALAPPPAPPGPPFASAAVRGASWRRQRDGRGLRAHLAPRAGPAGRRRRGRWRRRAGARAAGPGRCFGCRGTASARPRPRLQGSRHAPDRCVCVPRCGPAAIDDWALGCARGGAARAPPPGGAGVAVAACPAPAISRASHRLRSSSASYPAVDKPLAE